MKGKNRTGMVDGASGGPVVARKAYLIYAVLCAGFLASQFYRVSNAVIAPELMRSLSVSPEEMGVVTGMFFLFFAAAQLPAGVLLDRFGPRGTMSALFLVAVAGAVVFATAEGVAGLALGRGLIGLGCATALMGSLVAVARWFPPDRFARLSSWLYTIGGTGFLLATTPLAWISETYGWRGAFWMMAGVTGLLAALLFAVVRDPPGAAATAVRESPREIWAGLVAVMANRDLWYICALQFVNYGTILALMGLWAGPYLNDVHGLDGIARGNVLLGLNVAMLAGVMAYTVVERWFNTRKWTIMGGGALSVVLLLALALAPGIGLVPAAALLVLFALASAYVMLIHAHARAILPDHLVGRGLTLQNLAVFLGVFVIQSATGVIVGEFQGAGGGAPEIAYRAVFGFLAAATLASLAVYVRIRDVATRD